MAAPAPVIIDQFAQLPHLTWRDTIWLPVAERSHEFAHEGAEQLILYRNGSFTEQTGAGARIFEYTIPLREGVTKGPYYNLFSNTLMVLWRSFHDDKSPGNLFDPIYGLQLCVPQRWSETTDVNKRDGVDVRISWKTHTPIDGSEESSSSSLDSLTSDAKRLDDEVQAINWPKQQPPPDATSDPLSAAAGVLQQGNYAIRRNKARFHAVAYKMGAVEDAAAEAESNGIPGAGFVRQDARRGRLRATKVAESPTRDLASTVVQVTIGSTTDLFSSARALGVSIQDLIELNPNLATTPTIPGGTKVWTRKK